MTRPRRFPAPCRGPRGPGIGGPGNGPGAPGIHGPGGPGGGGGGRGLALGANKRSVWGAGSCCQVGSS
ncbi:hypothetical protein GEV43_27235 [Actinomadura sp. J1-007]|nr:hypothetical protein [Actinomadura sp. J1-007]